jgi:hypothetical protein
MSKRIDFYITNPNHHWENFRPVILALKKKSIPVRIVSLCEFRRMDSPIEEWHELGIDYNILFSLKFSNTTASTGKKSIGGNQSLLRNLIRDVIWFTKLRPSLIKANRVLPKLAVIPNDIAYPLIKILAFFKSKKLTTVLYQEGIRFPLPNEDGGMRYGTNGTNYVFTWGLRSSQYFSSLGVSSEKIIEVGNPRFDKMLVDDYENDIVAIKKSLQKGYINFLYASNPVDDQGFCTYDTKLQLFDQFLKTCCSLDMNITVWLRLHPRENKSDFQRIIEKYIKQIRVNWAMNSPLFAYVKLMDATIVLASTVGLESLLNKTPIGVIKLPEPHNYVFDYVSRDAATPINLDDLSAACISLNNLINKKDKGLNGKERDYIREHLSYLSEGKTIFTSELLKII